MTDLENFYGQLEERKRAILNGPYTPEQLDWKSYKGRKPTGDPLDMPDLYWGRHALMLAQVGMGKTNGLRWRIRQMTPALRARKATLILMEPKGDLTAEVRGYARQEGLHVIELEPGDPAICVNLFDIDDTSAQSVNTAVNRIRRIFSTITSGLTAFQANVLTFAVRALFAMPEPRTLDMLFDIVRNGIPANLQVSTSVRNFFAQDFKENKARAKEVIGRMNSLLADPVFEALFSGERTTFDLFGAMQAGSVIIINAGEADSLYGRFWIEQIDRTIRRRIRLENITPVTFIIDEAQEWISNDEHFAHILDLARGAKIGMFIAFQHLEQIVNPRVRHSILSCTAIKFVAKTTADVHSLCRSLGNVETHFISRLKDYEFAFYAPNMEEARVVKLPLVEFPRSTKPQRKNSPLKESFGGEFGNNISVASPVYHTPDGTLPDEPTHDDIYC